jgi:hypothetical protein
MVQDQGEVTYQEWPIAAASKRSSSHKFREPNPFDTFTAKITEPFSYFLTFSFLNLSILPPQTNLMPARHYAWFGHFLVTQCTPTNLIPPTAISLISWRIYSSTDNRLYLFLRDGGGGYKIETWLVTVTISLSSFELYYRTHCTL